jgi:hypothetical protein
MGRIRSAEIDPLVTDPEMLSLLQAAYFDLVETVLLLRGQLLEATGENYDFSLQQVQLTGNGLAGKVRGWRRALDRVLVAHPASARDGSKKRWNGRTSFSGALETCQASG